MLFVSIWPLGRMGLDDQGIYVKVFNAVGGLFPWEDDSTFSWTQRAFPAAVGSRPVMECLLTLSVL